MADDGKRSALAQERSRETRRRLVRAALALWGKRGYPEGIDTTTAAEIAEAAGVSKATFYLHFSRKEDVLAEMATTTSGFFDDEATALLAKDLPTTRVLDRLHSDLAKRIQAADPAAVALAMIEVRRQAIVRRTTGKGPAFVTTYARVLLHGKARRDLPRTLDVDETARILHAVVVDAIEEWAMRELEGAVTALRATLLRRTAIILRDCSSTK